MLILDQKRLVQSKLEQLNKGEIAYAESKEIIRLVKRELNKQNFPVVYDETDSGCWFIPQHETVL
ncbi:MULTISPECIES: hypothetical protein [Pontibacillus]|uniref:Uncharacterized protein n=1 Tax=Pontibacillus marinus BH030004 = DSM 16465 TaxID=1385511 RepID=A0A0A5HLM0_9BACI|nr:MULTISPECIES: hypothetical protein [Pontibacillus]KGX84487.1 hypothetical protein N783_14290 [Pontibacillus marinus BH030004 = DSM 16465]QHE53241.1 hypothetical protein GS400_14960 [Pontibacillus sp. HMF3514]